MADIQNGDRVRDRVTSFEGIVTGVSEYISGCRQVLVVPPATDGKYNEGHWFDDDRVELISAGVITMPDRKRDGGPQSNPAPKR